jgi:hypothetical protein
MTSIRTTQLYDWREDRVALDEEVKINIRGRLPIVASAAGQKKGASREYRSYLNATSLSNLALGMDPARRGG